MFLDVDCKGKPIPFPKAWGGPRAWPLNFKPYNATFTSAFGENVDADDVPWLEPKENPPMILVRHADSSNNEKRRKKRGKSKK